MGDDGLQRWTVGDVRVTGVCEDQTDHIPPELFFPDATADDVLAHEWARPAWVDDQGNVGLRVQAFVVETPSHIATPPRAAVGRSCTRRSSGATRSPRRMATHRTTGVSAQVVTAVTSSTAT